MRDRDNEEHCGLLGTSQDDRILNQFQMILFFSLSLRKKAIRGYKKPRVTRRAVLGTLGACQGTSLIFICKKRTPSILHF